MPLVEGKAAVVQVPGTQLKLIVPDQFAPVLDAGPGVDDVLPIDPEDAQRLAEMMRAGDSGGIREVGPDQASVRIHKSGMTWTCDGRDTGWISTAEEMHAAAAAVERIPEIREDLRHPACDAAALATLLGLHGLQLSAIVSVEATVSEWEVGILFDVHHYDLVSTNTDR